MDMKMYLRMTHLDRLMLDRLHLRVLVRIIPRHAKTIAKIIRLIRQQEAPRTSLRSTLQVILGRRTLDELTNKIMHRFIELKIKRRILTDSRPSCHGCLSYRAEIACVNCGRLTFCYGCCGYECCKSCFDQSDVEDEL